MRRATKQAVNGRKRKAKLSERSEALLERIRRRRSGRIVCGEAARLDAAADAPVDQRVGHGLVVQLCLSGGQVRGDRSAQRAAGHQGCHGRRPRNASAVTAPGYI